MSAPKKRGEHYSKTHRVTYSLQGGQMQFIPIESWGWQHQLGLDLEYNKRLLKEINEIAANVANNTTDHQASDDCTEICRMIEDFKNKL